MRRISLVLAVAAIGGLVAAANLPSLAAGVTVTVAQGTEPASLDASQEISRSGYNVTLHVYDPLFMRSESGKIIPMLATGYKIVSPTEWEFSLRKGVHFHNGEPFDATAVKFTLDQDMLKSSAQSYLVTGVRDVQIADPYTVRVTTMDPMPLLIYNLTLAGIMPPRYYQSQGASYVATHPVGTGAI